MLAGEINGTKITPLVFRQSNRRTSETEIRERMVYRRFQTCEGHGSDTTLTQL